MRIFHGFVSSLPFLFNKSTLLLQLIHLLADRREYTLFQTRSKTIQRTEEGRNRAYLHSSALRWGTVRALDDQFNIELRNRDILSAHLQMFYLQFLYVLGECRDHKRSPFGVLVRILRSHLEFVQFPGKSVHLRANSSDSVCICVTDTSDRSASQLEAMCAVSSGAAIWEGVRVGLCVVGEGTP